MMNSNLTQKRILFDKIKTDIVILTEQCEAKSPLAKNCKG